VTLIAIFDVQFQDNHDASPALYRHRRSHPSSVFLPSSGDDHRSGLAMMIVRPMRVVQWGLHWRQKPRNLVLLGAIEYFEDSLFE
jgi:hypothetical protein